MSSNKGRRNNKGEDTNPDYQLSSIGNYYFVKTLGEGNFAKVKLATHKLTHQEVAIKMIDKTSIDEKKLAKLYREVRIMKMLRHPNIVTLFEVIETKHSLFLVMEYASGGELYDFLVVHGRTKEKDARVKFRQILSAVWYCHQKRVIHRDLKAENLLLDANFNVKIADFGFSNMYDPASQLDTFCGSPPYAAPELFQGRAYVGPEVDVWSLGVILYVLTTGYLPFDGKTLAEMRESVCKAKYRIPFYLSEGVERLLKKMLVRDPTKRASLEVIADDPWLNEGYDGSPFGPISASSSPVEEDEGLVSIIEAKFKIPRDAILKSLRENLYDDVSAIYFLLHAEKQRDAKTKVEEIIYQPTFFSPPTSSKLAGINSNGTPPGSTKMSPISEDESGCQAVPAFSLGSTPSTSRNNSLRVVAGSQTTASHSNSSSPPKREPSRELKQPEAKRAESPRPELRQLAVGVGHRRRFTVGTNEEPQRPASPLRQASNPPTSAPPAPASAAAPPFQPRTRARGNTITSIFKNRKPSASDSSSPGAGSSAEDEKPRSLRFTFNSKTTSTVAPQDMVTSVIRTCVALGFCTKPTTKFLIEVSLPTEAGTKFEIEVCRLPRLNNVHGLRFKRLVGSSSEYKAACERFLERVRFSQ